MAHLASKFLMLLKILCVSSPGAVLVSFLCKTLFNPQIYLSACCNCLNKVSTIMLCNFCVENFVLKIGPYISHHYRVIC